MLRRGSAVFAAMIAIMLTLGLSSGTAFAQRKDVRWTIDPKTGAVRAPVDRSCVPDLQRVTTYVSAQQPDSLTEQPSALATGVDAYQCDGTTSMSQGTVALTTTLGRLRPGPALLFVEVVQCYYLDATHQATECIGGGGPIDGFLEPESQPVG